jgi:hypothetical protein
LDADQHKWKKEELIAYDNASIAEQDEKGKLTAAKKKGKEEERNDNIIGLHENSVPIPIIAKSLKLSEADVLKIIEARESK